MERISWRNVRIYDEDGIEFDEDIRREKLAEYRRDGSMTDYFFVDPREHNEPWVVTPEIDWAGFDESRYEVVIDRISEPYGKGFSFVTVHYHFERDGMSTGDGGQSERITVYGLAGDDEAIREHCQSELEKMNQEG